LEPVWKGTLLRLRLGRSKISRRKGVALFRFKDLVGGADVIFGEPGAANFPAPSRWKLSASLSIRSAASFTRCR
jgi:hypothetical protein